MLIKKLDLWPNFTSAYYMRRLLDEKNVKQKKKGGNKFYNKTIWKL